MWSQVELHILSTVWATIAVDSQIQSTTILSIRSVRVLQSKIMIFSLGCPDFFRNTRCQIWIIFLQIPYCKVFFTRSEGDWSSKIKTGHPTFSGKKTGSTEQSTVKKNMNSLSIHGCHPTKRNDSKKTSFHVIWNRKENALGTYF